VSNAAVQNFSTGQEFTGFCRRKPVGCRKKDLPEHREIFFCRKRSVFVAGKIRSAENYRFGEAKDLIFHPERIFAETLS
jgi:hypothetical protein